MRFWLFPLTAMALWAGNVIVSKLAAGIIAPPAITFYRLVVAVALMSVFIALPAWRNHKAVKQALPKLLFLGFLSMAFYQCLSYWAANTSTATNMAIITALTPLATLLMSTLVLRDRPTPVMLLGAAIALTGTLYLVGQGHIARLLQGGWHVGDLLMLAAVSSYALYSVLLRYWKLALPAWQSTYLQALAALAFMTPMMLFVPGGQAQFSGQSLPLVLYAGILASVALPFCWIKGIEYLGPNRCSMTMNLLPVFTAGLAVAILDERLHTYHLIGGGMALLGVVLSQLLVTVKER